MGAIEHTISNPSLRIGLKNLLFKQLQVLLGDGITNFKIHFLKLLRIFEFHIDKSRSFHSKSPESQTELFKMKTGYIQTNFQ